MPSIRFANRLTTAIPPRFRLQRLRVLRILARWERAALERPPILSGSDQLPRVATRGAR